MCLCSQACALETEGRCSLLDSDDPSAVCSPVRRCHSHGQYLLNPGRGWRRGRRWYCVGAWRNAGSAWVGGGRARQAGSRWSCWWGWVCPQWTTPCGKSWTWQD